jgi:hypothetical protein
MAGMHTRKDRSLRYFRTARVCTILAFALTAQVIIHAQEPVDQATIDGKATADPNSNPNAIHLIGLPDTKPAVIGMLKLTKDTVEFTTSDIHASIPYKRIVGVFVGTERTEAGGKTGALARKMPYGVGPVFSLASQKQVDLLSIEFRDIHGGYHGTVFALPLKSGAALQNAITARTPPPHPIPEPINCGAGAPVPNTVMLASVKVEGVDLPAEYRVLLYEHIYHVLSTTDVTDSYLRPGDTSATAGCPALTLHITVVGFTKGNQSLRAVTGPLGMFVGVTSVTFHVKLDDSHGTVVLEKDIKKSKRGDSDSLNLARDIAKDISKRVNKEINKDGGTGQP